MEQRKQETPEKIDLFPILRNLWKQFCRLWWVPILLALLGGGFFCLRAVRSFTPMYQSEATLSASVDTTGTTDIVNYSYYYDNEAAQMAAETFPYLLNSDVMKERLKLALDTDVINGNIQSASIPGTNFFVLTVTSTNAQSAYDIIQAVLDIYPQISRLVIGDTQMTVTQEPVLAQDPYNSLSWKTPTVKGAVLGVGAGAALLFVLALSNPTVLVDRDVKRIVNLPCLTQVPNIRRKRRSNDADRCPLTTGLDADSDFSEAFRLLRVKLLRRLGPDDKVILFTSSLPSEGKSSLAVNTALTLARDGKEVLLIDGDLRAQSLKSLLGLEQKSLGLSTYLDPNGPSEMQFLRFENTTMYLLAGDETVRNPIPLLKHDRLSRIMGALRQRFDYIIIDTPPCAMMADAATLSTHVDQAIYVIREDYASRSQILDGIYSLNGAGVSICGFAMNRTTSRSARYGYGYGYGYGRKYGYGYDKAAGSKSGTSGKQDD